MAFKILKNKKLILPTFKYPVPVASMLNSAGIAGKAYYTFTELTIATGSTEYIEVVIPDKVVKWLTREIVTTGAPINGRVLKNVSFSTQGTEISLFNSNHNIGADASDVLLYSNSTDIDETNATTTGKLLIPEVGKHMYSGNDIHDILYTAQRNTTYCLKLTNNSGSEVTIKIDWQWIEYDD